MAPFSIVGSASLWSVADSRRSLADANPPPCPGLGHSRRLRRPMSSGPAAQEAGIQSTSDQAKPGAPLAAIQGPG